MGELEFGLVIDDGGDLAAVGAVGAHDQGDEVLGLGVDVAAVEVLELTVLIEVFEDVDEYPAVVQTPTREEIERYAWTDVAIYAIAQVGIAHGDLRQPWESLAFGLETAGLVGGHLAVDSLITCHSSSPPYSH